MKLRQTAYIFLFTCGLSGLALADQVTLKNGDKITGAIIKKDGANLVMKSSAAGPITIPWDQVDAITTDGPLTVVTAGDHTVQSQITSTGGKLVVGGTQVATADIVAIRNPDEQKAFERLEHPGWGDLWAGNAGLNFAGTSGNTDTKTFVITLNGARVTRTDKTSIYFTAVKSSASGVDTAQAIRGGWSYNRNLRPKLYATVFNDWEYDKFQDLDLRFVLGAGLGYHAWSNKKGFFDLVGGIDYARDKFGALPAVAPSTVGTPESTNSRAELFYGDDFGYKLNSKTSLTQSWRMFHNFSDFGGYRMNFDVGATTQLTKWLTWNAGISDRYLAKPVGNRVSNDIIYSTGIGVTFAR